MLRIKLVKSPIGNTPRNRATVAALGLRKINKTVEHNDTPMIRGMIHHVKHMLEVTEVEGTPKSNLANKRRDVSLVKEKPAKVVRVAKPKVEKAAKVAVAPKPKAAKPAKPAKAVKAEKAPAEKPKPKGTTKKAKTKEEN